MAVSTKIQGTHHLQGNVQVYNVRIPVMCATINPGKVRARDPPNRKFFGAWCLVVWTLTVCQLLGFGVAALLILEYQGLILTHVRFG